MDAKNQSPAYSYECPTTSAAAAVETAASTRTPSTIQFETSHIKNAITSRQISTDLHSAAIAAAQLHMMGAQRINTIPSGGGDREESSNKEPSRTIIRKIINIDKNKLQQSGLDRKIAAVLSKQKLATKSAAVTAVEKPIPIPYVNQAPKLQKARSQPQLLSPSERLIEAKKFLSQKLLNKGVNASTSTNTPVPIALISRPTTTIADHNNETTFSSSRITASAIAASLKKVDDIKVNKANKISTQKVKKFTIKKIQTPQEIARVLDFDGANKSSSVQPISSNISHEKISQNLPSKTGNNLPDKVPRKLPKNSAIIEPYQPKRQPNFMDEFIKQAFQNDNNEIPKASIRKSFDKRCIPPTTPAAGHFEPKSFKNTECPGISPVKIPFPSTTLPQEAPLPTISTFKKPFLPQKGIVAPINYELPDTKQQTTKSLIVLEDKVLSHDEKIDLTTVFGLAESSGSQQLQMPLPKPIIIKEEKHDDMQTFNLPAIGETISTDPKEGLVVVNPTQPKKFIIAVDKSKLSKDKIADLAKQIKTQVKQKSKNKNLAEIVAKNKELIAQSKQNIEIEKNYPNDPHSMPEKVQKEAIKYNVAPIPILYGNTVVNFEITSQMNENTFMSSNTLMDSHFGEKSNTGPVVTKIKTIERYPNLENLVSTNTNIETKQQEYGIIAPITTQNSTTSIFEEKLSTSLTKVNENPIIISSQNTKPIIMPNQNPAIAVILQKNDPSNPTVETTTAVEVGSKTVNAGLHQKTLNKNFIANLIQKPATKIILLKKIPDTSTISESTTSASVQCTVPNYETQNLECEKPTTSSKIIQANTSGTEIGDCDLNETELNSSLSAVDFIASLAASNSFNKNYGMELSAEECNLNASLNLSASEKMLLENLTSSENMLLENATLTENVLQPKDKNDVDATALIAQMFDKDNSKDLLKENWDQTKTVAFNTQFTENTTVNNFINDNNDITNTTNAVAGLNGEVTKGKDANEIINDNQLNIEVIDDQLKEVKEISSEVVTPNADNGSEQVPDKVSNFSDAQNWMDKLNQPDQVIQSNEITLENNQIVEQNINFVHIREEISELIEDKKNLIENIKHHNEEFKDQKLVSSELSSSSISRQPLRLKKGKINLVQRKKITAATEKGQTEKQHELDQDRAVAKVQKDLTTSTVNLSDKSKITEKDELKSLETLQTKTGAIASQDLPELEEKQTEISTKNSTPNELSAETVEIIQADNVDRINENKQTELAKTMEPLSIDSLYPKFSKTFPKKQQNNLQDLQAQKDKETEVAKVLVSLIQPPDENEEIILKPAKNPFKQQPLEAKIHEETNGITSLINKIEDNKLQKEKINDDDLLTKDVTMEQQNIINSTNQYLQKEKQLMEVNNSSQLLSESIKKVIASNPDNSCHTISNSNNSIVEESTQDFEFDSEHKRIEKEAVKINEYNSTVELEIVSSQYSESICVQQIPTNGIRNKILDSNRDFEETSNKRLNEINIQNSESTALCCEKDTVSNPNKMSASMTKSAVVDKQTEIIQGLRKELKSTTVLATNSSDSTTNAINITEVNVDEKFTIETNKNFVDDASLNKLTDHQQKITPGKRVENEDVTSSDTKQADIADNLRNTSILQDKETSVKNLNADANIKSNERSPRSGRAKIKTEKEEKTTHVIVQKKVATENSSINKIPVALGTTQKLQEQMKLSKGNKKRRFNSKISNTDTQSDIDITDLDCSTRESNDETAKEESSQEQAVTRNIRKRLRKTIDDVKRGRKVHTETDTDEEHLNSSPDSNEFLGFDEALQYHRKIEEKLKVLIAATSAEEEESGDDKTRDKKAVDVTKIDCQNINKKSNKSTASLKVTAKTMPLKKRWEFAHKPPTAETDITDDTSPANDEDDDNDVVNIVTGKKKQETISTKIAKKRHHEKLNSPSKSQIVKKAKMESSTEGHKFVEPEALGTIKSSPTGTPEKEFISNNEIFKSHVDNAKLVEEQITTIKEKRRARPSRKLEATKVHNDKLEVKEKETTNINSHGEGTVLTPTTSATTTLLRKRIHRSDSTVIASKLVILSEPPVLKSLEPSTPYMTKITSRKSKDLDNSAIMSNEEENKEFYSVENSKINEPKSIIEVFTTNENVKVPSNPEYIEEPSISKASTVSFKRNLKAADKNKEITKTTDVFQRQTIESKANKTILDVVPLSATPVEKKKRGRKPKSNALDTNDVHHSETKVVGENYVVSNTPETVRNTSKQTPEMYIESEKPAAAAKKEKRGRKSKLSILERNDMSLSVIEVEGDNLAASDTSIPTMEIAETVSNTLIQTPETYFESESVAATGKKVKRGRKSKLSILEHNDMSPSVIEADGNNLVVSDTAIPTMQTPEKHVESESVRVVEKKKRGRKPKLSALVANDITPKEMANSETHVAAAADTVNISLSEKSNISDQSQFPTDAANISAEKKKPGRKRVFYVAEASDTNSMETPEIFNMRLLLICSRSQLTTNEELTSKDGKPAAGFIKCGLCLGNTKKDKWLLHLGEHYGVGWIDGKPALDLTNRYTVLNTMTNYYKQTKVKGLNCRICKNLYRSALGLLIHVESCGLSAEEQKKNRVNCSYCQNSYTKLSLVSHIRTCTARMAAEKAENVVNTDEMSTEEVLNNVGRIKRVSLIKAESMIKKIGEELTTTTSSSFDPTKHIKFVESVTKTDWKSKSQSDILKFGKCFCSQNVCKFFCTDLTEMEDHLQTCKYIPKTGYHCTICKRKTSVFNTNELALRHVNKVHKPREAQDFEGDSTDCDLENESTGEDDSCSSGVDSNEENTTNSEDDDYDVANAETDSKKIKSKKKKQKQRQRPIVARPQNDTKFKPVFPPRYSNVEKHVFNSWKEFISQNYTLDDILFSCLTPKIYSLNNDKEIQLEKSLPRHNESIKFSFNTFKNIEKSFGAPASQTTEWLELKRFGTHVQKADIFNFIGAPIKLLTWAPLPKDCNTEDQFLAICYRKDINKYTRFLQPKIQPTHILIYKINIKSNNDIDKMKLHYALHIADGPVHSLEFLPSGGYAPALNRLGLLAVGTACSNIHVYSLPLEIPESPKQYKNDLLKLNVINLQVAFVLSLNLNSTMPDVSTDVQCLKLKWSEFRGHNLIFAGFSNGFIGTWDVSDDDENLNRFIVNDLRHFVPLNYFYCGEKTIQELALHYDTNGPRWLAVSAFARTLLLFDLCDLTNPYYVRNEIAKNNITTLDWPLMWENFVMALGSALQNNGESLLIKSTMGLQFNLSKALVVPGGATQAKFNPWFNLYVATSEYGDLYFQKMRELHFESIDLRSKSKVKVVGTMDVKYLDGKPMHRAASKIKSNDAESTEHWQIMFEDDYKEKYGLVFTSLATLPCTENLSEKRQPPENITRYMRINCVSWNLNSSGRNLLACGYDNGFLRILNFKATEFFD